MTKNSIFDHNSGLNLILLTTLNGMKYKEKKVIISLLIGTLLVTGLIGICCYFVFGLEIAIISVFSALLGFTILHLFLFYLWIKGGNIIEDEENP